MLPDKKPVLRDKHKEEVKVEDEKNNEQEHDK